MKLTDLLDRPIAYHRIFVTMTGSVKAAIMLSQAMYWQSRAKQKDGWWYKSAKEWEEETGLTSHEQATARKDCEPFLMCELRGVPATLFWKVNELAISQYLFSEKRETSLAETAKLDSRKPQNINKEPETTTENTTENTSTDSEKKSKKMADKKVDAMLGMMDMPGLKKEQRILTYETLVKVKTGVEPTRVKWRPFFDFVDRQDKPGAALEIFLNWLIKQPKFDASFWGPDRMRENWNRAFIQDVPQGNQHLPSGV